VKVRAPRRGPTVTRADQAAGGLAVISLLAGIALLIVGSGAVAESVGIGLLGLSGIAFMALVFLLVGESEERDREGRPL
jgi:hypothetical protein